MLSVTPTNSLCDGCFPTEQDAYTAAESETQIDPEYISNVLIDRCHFCLGYSLLVVRLDTPVERPVAPPDPFTGKVRVQATPEQWAAFMAIFDE